jgi:hypothetical protein
MDESTGNGIGLAPDPDINNIAVTSGGNDVTVSENSKIKSSEQASQASEEDGDDNIIIQTHLLGTPVQMKLIYQENGLNFLVMWCAGHQMPNRKEMKPLARFSFKNTTVPEVFVETEYPGLAPALTENIEMLPITVIEKIEESQTVMVACQTLTSNMIRIAGDLQALKNPRKLENPKRSLMLRAERESQALQMLVEADKLALERTLGIIKKTESVWLINALKYACSVRGEELAHFYNSGATSFEHKETTWYEISWDKVLKKKVRNAITSFLPDFMREWMTDLRIRRENLRKIT